MYIYFVLYGMREHMCKLNRYIVYIYMCVSTCFNGVGLNSFYFCVCAADKRTLRALAPSICTIMCVSFCLCQSVYDCARYVAKSRECGVGSEYREQLMRTNRYHM